MTYKFDTVRSVLVSASPPHCQHCLSAGEGGGGGVSVGGGGGGGGGGGEREYFVRFLIKIQMGRMEAGHF